MKASTIERILNNYNRTGHDTVIGAYTYRFNPYTGTISRCKTENVGRTYLNSFGEVVTDWVAVASVAK